MKVFLLIAEQRDRRHVLAVHLDANKAIEASFAFAAGHPASRKFVACKDFPAEAMVRQLGRGITHRIEKHEVMR